MDKRYKIIKNDALTGSDEGMDVKISTIKDHISDKININFDLLSGSEIKLTLFNVLGKAEFYLKNQYEAGINTIKFCTSEFQKGLYFLEMMSGGKKLVTNIWIK